MTNEDKILSMLDIIAAQTTTLTQQVATLTETSVTKDEFNDFKEHTYDRFNKIEEQMVTKDEFNGFKEHTYDRFDKIEEQMVTKDELNGFKEQVCDHLDKHVTENTAAHETILAKIEQQAESSDGKFDALNIRLFTQEAELSVLKKREVL
jgi:hypothetical protein